jgi:alpha-1,2-mannosyltransferase
VAIVAFSALALALRMYQLARPGFLLGVSEYDDGVYFGSAVRLVHGALPYRDYVLVQPPGIVLLMTPLALLAKATGTATAFAAARVLTACASVACIPLAGWLVRHRGPLAVTVVCGLLAVYPAGIDAAHTLLLEPWLVLFCLAGALVAFDRERLAERPRRLAWAGAAFGLACAIKLWAVLPALVVALLCARPRSRPLLRRYLAGAAAGFAVPVLPFLLPAPGAFYRDVVVAQLSRVDVTRASPWTRLQSMVGLSVLNPAAHATVALVAVGLLAVTLGSALAGWRRRRRPPTALEAFAWLSGVAILAALLWPADFYPHYAWFFAPFLALTLGLAVARVAPAPAGWTAPEPAAWTPAALALATAAVAALGVQQFRDLSTLRSGDPTPLVRRDTPPGSCVLTDLPPVTILSDRFVSDVKGCSRLVDPIGTSYALSHGHNGVTGAGRTPAVQALWRSAFATAQYVWLQCPPWMRPQCLTSRRVPWTPALRLYFVQRFKPLPGQGARPSLFARRPA